MGIVFKLYGWIWIIILFLYNLNWSDFSQPIDKELLFFLLFTIIISFILGYFFKPFQNKNTIKVNKNTKYIVSAIWIGFIINFIYAKYIPFLALINGNYSYVEFEGIPTLFPFLYTFSLFYFFYLVYLYFETKNKSYFKQALSLIIIFISFFSRSLLVFALLGSILIKLMTINKKKIILNYKNIIIIIITVIFVCYMFGVLGNIRTGYAWNDCSYIENLGLYTHYPRWLPKQFMWIYSYLISPLANLNLNCIQDNSIHDIAKLLACFIPEFVSKRFFPMLVVSSLNETLLVRSYFNAQTAYVNFYYCYGILGCYLAYFALVFINIVIHFICKKKKVWNPLIIVILGIFMTMTFFYNVFYYTLTSLLLIWCFIYIIFSNTKFKIKIK